jgi:hypothetical protein
VYNSAYDITTIIQIEIIWLLRLQVDTEIVTSLISEEIKEQAKNVILKDEKKQKNALMKESCKQVCKKDLRVKLYNIWKQ